MAPKLSMEDQMRARFHEAVSERDAIIARAKPYRDEYEAISAEISDITVSRLKPAAEKMKAAEEGLYEIDVEIGKITRFLRDGTFAATGDTSAAKAK